jgi:hypothetical protein
MPTKTKKEKVKAKTPKEIQEMIDLTEKDNAHILQGSLATVDINAPRALMQLSAESHLDALYWALGKKYKSKLKSPPNR